MSFCLFDETKEIRPIFMCTFDRHSRHSMCADADLPGYSNERIYFCLPLKLLLSLVGFQFSFRKIMSVSVQCVPFGDMVSFLLFVKLFVWSNFGWHHLYGVVKHCDLIKHTVNIASLAVNALFFCISNDIRRVDATQAENVWKWKKHEKCNGRTKVSSSISSSE